MASTADTSFGPLRSALVPLLLVLALVAAACSSDTTDVASDTTTTSSDRTTTSTSEPEPVATTAVTTTTPPTMLEVDADGWFPWIFPSPTLSWFEEGCPSPEGVIADFMANFFDDPTAELTSLSASSHPDERRFVVHSRGENGVSMDSGTMLILSRVDLEVVDCRPWVIVSADSELVTIDEVGFSADAQTGGAVIDVSGQGSGFEATIGIRAHDESFRMVAEGFGMGGSFDVAPFAGQAHFNQQVIDSNLIVIAASDSPADGAVPQFAARKARCCEGLEVVVPVAEPGPAFAVVGVEFDDTLNVRSGPGVANDIVAELSPFMIGMQILDDAPVPVAGDDWVRIADVGDEGVDGWVNSRFINRVDGEHDAALMVAAFQVREAVSSNSTASRLGDVLAGQGASTILVSTDAFLADDDQQLSIDDLATAGTAADTVRQWGFTDGEGSPIEATILDYFEGYKTSSALVSTDRVGVDVRFVSSNTIDNMTDRFPSATVVEIHHAGGEGDSAAFEWGTIRLAFEPKDDGYALVAIATDNWTI